VASFGVVAFSIFGQGLTMPRLIKILGLSQKIEPIADGASAASRRSGTRSLTAAGNLDETVPPNNSQ